MRYELNTRQTVKPKTKEVLAEANVLIQKFEADQEAFWRRVADVLTEAFEQKGCAA